MAHRNAGWATACLASALFLTGSGPAQAQQKLDEPLDEQSSNGVIPREDGSGSLLGGVSRLGTSTVLAGATLSSAAQAADVVRQSDERYRELLVDARVEHDPDHTPQIKVPLVVETANRVSVTLTVPLDGDEEHYIRRVALLDENSLVKWKYSATLSPVVSHVEITSSIKMAKDSRLQAVVECSLHGKWIGASAPIRVGAGGCGADQAPSRALVDEVLRVRFRNRGQEVHTGLLFRHPMSPGYVLKSNQFVQKYEPFFLESARLVHGGRVIASFEMSSGLSENPHLGLLLPRLSGQPLLAEAVNSHNQRFSLKARMPVPLAARLSPVSRELDGPRLARLTHNEERIER